MLAPPLQGSNQLLAQRDVREREEKLFVPSARPLPITDPCELRAALEKLDERERRILELRCGLGGERRHTLAEIGELLGFSGERARQLEARARRKLVSQDAPRPVRKGRPPGTSAAFLQRFVRPWALLLLRAQPTYGYELKKRLCQLGLPEFDPRFLQRLEDEGCLCSTWTPSSDVGPSRRVYRLTDKGTSQLQSEAEALQQVEATLRAFFAQYDEVLALLERQRE